MHPPAEHEGIPDWTALNIEPLCPLCQYNLRGLAVPRCPECGYQFNWRDLTDVDRRQHPYLFEHHPSHNIWSFFKTVSMSVLPGRFWRSLSPLQPTSSGRLFLYVILTTIPLLLPLGAEWFRAILVEWDQVKSTQAFWGANPPKPPGFWELAKYAWSDDSRVLIPMLVIIACFVIWPCLNFLALRFIFGQSMRRAKVSSAHVMRCIVYSHDATFWWGWLMALVAVLSIWVQWDGHPLIREMFIKRWPNYIALAWALIINYRLWQAYRLYLRFDLAWATILASQIVVLLSVITVLIVIADRRGW